MDAVQLTGYVGSFAAYSALFFASWAALREIPTLMAPEPPRESGLVVLDPGDPNWMKGAEIGLKPSNTIGSDPNEADILISDGVVAPLHAELLWRNGRWHLRRLSPHGRLAVNGSPVPDHRVLRDGDRIEMGRTSFRLRIW